MADTNTWLGLNETQALLLTGLIVAIIAAVGVATQRAITARQETLDFLQRSEADKELIAARAIFHDHARRPEGIAKWALEINKDSPETRAIRLLLNEYELIAIGIGRGVFDNTTHRRWHRSAVVRNWRLAAPYVFALRSRLDNDSVFHEVEELARWYGPSQPRRRFILRKFF